MFRTHMLRSLQIATTPISKAYPRVPILVTVSKTLFHWNTGLQQPKSTTAISEGQRFTEQELLRQKATEIESSALLRSRTPWTAEEDERLLALVEQHDKSWTYLTNFFVDRPAAALHNRYHLLIEQKKLGGLSKEEWQALKEFGNKRPYEAIDDWEKLADLPVFHNRPLYLIKLAYKHSVDPSIRHGRWTKEETEKLWKYVQLFGEVNMEKIAQLIGTRTRRQCLEKWRWQMTDKRKGRFSPEEDRLILEAVNKYGENFAAVCQVTGIDRTPRHVSQHYHHTLNPAIDRSPWTLEETKLVYETCLANDRSMLKTKNILGSRRSVRDMWNRFKLYSRQLEKHNKKGSAPTKAETNRQNDDV